MSVPYVVVRDGHCGPARLLPIIMANDDTEAVLHSAASVADPSQNAVRVTGYDEGRALRGAARVMRSG